MSVSMARGRDAQSRWGLLLSAVGMVAAALVVLATTASARAADDDDEDARDGNIVTIDPGSQPPAIVNDKTLLADDEDAAEPAAPTYWIGIQGGPVSDPMLRSHLQLADDTGVAVMSVVPGSPAEKAGIKQHDILLEVDGAAITDMPQLQRAVAASEGKAVELKLIRMAKEMKVSVTPDQAPEELQARLGVGGRAPLAGGMPLPGGMNFEQLFRQLQPGGGMRIIGPGLVMGNAGAGLAQFPGGVSIAVTRENDQPAKVVVKKGDESWTVSEDDQEAIAKLPDDVRPFVQRMLHGNGLNLNMNAPFAFEWGAGPQAEVQQQLEAARAQMDAARQQAEQQVRKLEQVLQQQARTMEQRLEEEHLQKAQQHLQQENQRLQEQMQQRMESLQKQIEQMQQRLEEKEQAQQDPSRA